MDTTETTTTETTMIESTIRKPSTVIIVVMDSYQLSLDVNKAMRDRARNKANELRGNSTVLDAPDAFTTARINDYMSTARMYDAIVSTYSQVIADMHAIAVRFEAENN